ncbi:HPF/RaiA family ribosome-associated protein [Phenylobacterium sp.]|uniref:HPF/RaiA family ribosome-associated protein n=1 Tax=Phenylobacterium sp. TaxID=1871053 RepID=UPI002C6264A6|nr:HPF/RaiA family ribosome-associated protein [Phenylobacterium sp.]HVI33579.1 HPF/RaiA family ribosome-associated protein [Phenylobacterium sp.]
MQIPLQITFEGGLTASEALQRRIEREAAKLERLNDRITSCRVAVIGRPGKRRHGDLYAVRLQITTPSEGEVVVDRNPPADHAHEDAFVTVRDAFAAARRRLLDRRRRVQGKVKVHEPPPQGRVARLFPDEGYGFIEAADGREIYFHRNAVLNGGFARMEPGVEVRFAEAEGVKGPQASTVHVH